MHRQRMAQEDEKALKRLTDRVLHRSDARVDREGRHAVGLSRSSSDEEDDDAGADGCSRSRHRRMAGAAGPLSQTDLFAPAGTRTPVSSAAEFELDNVFSDEVENPACLRQRVERRRFLEQSERSRNSLLDDADEMWGEMRRSRRRTLQPASGPAGTSVLRKRAHSASVLPPGNDSAIRPGTAPRSTFFSLSPHKRQRFASSMFTVAPAFSVDSRASLNDGDSASRAGSSDGHFPQSAAPRSDSAATAKPSRLFAALRDGL